jgi:hypothetical protein
MLTPPMNVMQVRGALYPPSYYLYCSYDLVGPRRYKNKEHKPFFYREQLDV